MEDARVGLPGPALQSSSERYWLSYGDACRLRGETAVAEMAYRQAMAYNTGYGVWYRLGMLQCDMMRFDEAVESFTRACRLLPGHAGLLCELAQACHDAFRLEEAIHWYREAIALVPDQAGIWFSLAKTHAYLGQTQAAVDACRTYLSLEAASPNPHHEKMRRAEINLRLLEADETDLAGIWNLITQVHFSMVDFAVPGAAHWDGEIRPDRLLAVVGRYGVGDVLQISRFLPALVERGQPCVLWLPRHRGFRRLIGTLRSPVSVYESGDPVPESPDFSLPHMDLPFKACNFDQALGRVPYFFPTPGPEHALTGTGTKVGIVWACGTRTQRTNFWSYRQRSAGLAAFAGLIRAHPRLAFYSLQFGPDASALADRPDLPISDLAPRIRDLYDTACFIQQLDLVISVDTSVAHLAGALGKPVWLLLPAGSDDRWGRSGDSTPWYPSARLFRQQTLLNWEPVMARVSAALASWRGDTVPLT